MFLVNYLVIFEIVNKKSTSRVYSTLYG